VTYRMHDRANVARVVALFRLNYERPWWERTPELPVTDRTLTSRAAADITNTSHFRGRAHHCVHHCGFMLRFPEVFCDFGRQCGVGQNAL
jgi:hypothetical protein